MRKKISIIVLSLLIMGQIFLLNHYFSAREAIYQLSEKNFRQVDMWDRHLKELLKDYAQTEYEEEKQICFTAIREGAHTAKMSNINFSPRLIELDSVAQIPYDRLMSDMDNGIPIDTDYYIEFFDKKIEYNAYFSAILGSKLNTTTEISHEVKNYKINIINKYISQGINVVLNEKQRDFLNMVFTDKLNLDQYYY